LGEKLREADQLIDISLPEEAGSVLGHDAAFSSLIAQTQANQLPSAIMLHGAKGIGKASFAFALAKEIFLITGDEKKLQIDRQVAAGSHPNLFIVRKTAKKPKGFYSDIRIDEVREIQKRMRKTRGRKGHRICIIDAIDDCNIKSSNALLKILEEPPANTIFILISHRPGSLLPTIHSRTQKYALKTLSDEMVQDILIDKVSDISPKNIENCVKLANGRPRRAIMAAMLEGLNILSDLQNWLDNEANNNHIALSEEIIKAGIAEQEFAREIIIDWIANQANFVAKNNINNRYRFASINKLWDKANEMFNQADIYNLDKKQTMVAILDACYNYNSTYNIK